MERARFELAKENRQVYSPVHLTTLQSLRRKKTNQNERRGKRKLNRKGKKKGKGQKTPQNKART
jgi:hypothetical protein